MRISFCTRHWKENKLKVIFFSKEDSTFLPAHETRITVATNPTLFLLVLSLATIPTPVPAERGKASSNFIIHPDFRFFIERNIGWCPVSHPCFLHATATGMSRDGCHLFFSRWTNYDDQSISPSTRNHEVDAIFISTFQTKPGLSFTFAFSWRQRSLDRRHLCFHFPNQTWSFIHLCFLLAPEITR